MRSLACLASLVALVALLPGVSPAAAQPEPKGAAPEGQPVFHAFTNVFRAAEPTVVGLRARQSVASDMSRRMKRVNDSAGAGETAWNVVRTTISVPFYLAKSLLEAALDPLSGPTVRQGLGSGFVIDDHGHVLTSLSVVRDATDIEATLGDLHGVSIRVLGTDPDTDLALLELPSDVAPKHVSAKLELGDSDTVTPGQWVMAIGCPYGTERTATVGVVSGIGRNLGIGPYDEYIQIDSAVNPGSSGGPLFDDQGRVIGISVAIPQNGQNVGFAIPINIAKAVLADLESGRQPIRGTIGVQMLRISPERKAEYQLQVSSGAVVTGVDLNGPAAGAGIHPGDVIVAIRGQPVRKPRDVQLGLRDAPVGSTVMLTIDRKGARLDLPLPVAQTAGEAQP